MFPKSHYTLPGRDLEQDLISNFKFKGPTPLVSIALLSVACSLHTIPNLENIFRSLVNNLRSGKLRFSNFSPTNGRTTLPTVKCFERCSFDTRVIIVIVREFYQGQVSIPTIRSQSRKLLACPLMFEWFSHSDHRSEDDRQYSGSTAYLMLYARIAKLSK
ncbi:hypothetical protein Tco_1109006 [Tanacetum coccineum]